MIKGWMKQDDIQDHVEEQLVVYISVLQ